MPLTLCAFPAACDVGRGTGRGGAGDRRVILEVPSGGIPLRRPETGPKNRATFRIRPLVHR